MRGGSQLSYMVVSPTKRVRKSRTRRLVSAGAARRGCRIAGHVIVLLMVSRDTTAAAAALQEAAYRNMGNDGRLRIALELSDLTHAFAIAGIRRNHPELSDDSLRRELARAIYGVES
jgi:hypothetical protein